MAAPRVVSEELRAEIKRRAGTKPARLIALELGLTENQVEGVGRRDGFSFKMHGQGPRVPAEMYREKLQAAATEGLTLKQAAERLGITRSSVGGYAKRLGISFSKEPMELRLAKMAAGNGRLRANRTPEELAELAKRRLETKRLYNEKRARRRKEERKQKGFAPRFSPHADGVFLTASKPGQRIPLPKVASEGIAFDLARAPGKDLVDLRHNECRWPIGNRRSRDFSSALLTPGAIGAIVCTIGSVHIGPLPSDIACRSGPGFWIGVLPRALKLFERYPGERQ